MEAAQPTHGGTLSEAALIFMDELCMNDSAKTPARVTSNSVKKHFYEACSESPCNHGSKGRGRVDPALKLHPDCPMMLTINSDASNGEANGSMVKAKQVHVKQGESPFLLKLDCGVTVTCLCASQVSAVMVEHEKEGITPRTFNVETETFSFNVRQRGTESACEGKTISNCQQLLHNGS